jgi:hypothetical protein
MWYPRSVNEKMEMGRYFGHTYNMPMYKIPERGAPPKALPGEEPYKGRHLLFDNQTDPRQQNPLNDPALEAKFVERLIAHLKICEAPAEQYTRLGLNAP